MTSLKLLELIKEDGGEYKVNSLGEANDFCRNLAESHYENFPVASRALPELEREHIFNVYAFARIADDIGDELKASAEEKIEALNKYEELLTGEKFDSLQAGNPIFVALAYSIKKKNLPIETFQRLLTAFKMDSDFLQPATYDDIEKYCHFSANPIGELVLRVFNLWNAETEPLSNAICTGLQVANFWQDLSRDIPNGRINIPKVVLDEYGISDIESADRDDLSDLIMELCNYAESLLFQGSKLPKRLKPRKLRFEIGLTIEGGLKIVKGVRRLGADAFKERPELSKIDFLFMSIKTLFLH